MPAQASVNKHDEILSVLSELSGQPATEIGENMTLGQLGIGGHPIGSAEFLDLRDKIEHKCHVKIPPNVTQDPDELALIKVREIFELVDSLPPHD